MHNNVLLSTESLKGKLLHGSYSCHPGRPVNQTSGGQFHLNVSLAAVLIKDNVIHGNMCLTKQKLSISLDYYWIFEFKQAEPFLKQFRSQSWVNISLACLPAASPEFNVATHSGEKKLQCHLP